MGRRVIAKLKIHRLKKANEMKQHWQHLQRWVCQPAAT
jgi:hypothetical protein